ncbi:MAG: hypothetical protein Athens101426_236 [Parcubacteria group bacterium Athens1014_26]|nr:MAG: hypothetical protein Athens101426_236 [Parcubacteria group bacterium Athens1014_26]
MRMKNKDKIIFPDLSYKIIGSTFEVFNELGWGLSEKDYQKALMKEFERRKIKFKREVYIPLQYKNINIGRYYADFIIEDKILLEIKVVSRFGYVHVKQLFGYLKSAGVKLGILLYFTKEGIKYRRVLNPDINICDI